MVASGTVAAIMPTSSSSNEPAKTAVDSAGASHHGELVPQAGVTFGLGAFQHDDAEYHGCQHVHGLIAGLDAGGGDVVHQGFGGHGADGVHHAFDDQNQQPQQMGFATQSQRQQWQGAADHPGNVQVSQSFSQGSDDDFSVLDDADDLPF